MKVDRPRTIPRSNGFGKGCDLEFTTPITRPPEASSHPAQVDPAECIVRI